MMIFKKVIPRRTFLRGAAATLALPVLDSMIPAFANTETSPATRLAFVYAPNGMIMEHWTPETEGAGFELPLILEPLAPFRDHFAVLSALNQNPAFPLPGDGDNAPHERAGGAYLTGVHPTREGSLGISVDQIAAKHLGMRTQLASLEIGLHDSAVIGQCEKGWNCGYLHTLSWRTPTTPLPTENRPRVVFERLFGDSDSTDPKDRLARIRRGRSLLDSVAEEAAHLLHGLGPRDRAKLTEYLDAVRDVERRIQIAEQQSSRELPVLEQPAGIPKTFDEHAKLMFDLQVLAFQSDLTRVCTFMMGREQSDRSFREIGIPDAHHQLTHHQKDPAKIAKVLQINIYHSKMFAYLLEKLQSTPDGDGSLMDHSMIVYGGGISDGNTHSYQDLPALLLGGGAGRIKKNYHVRYPKDTPMTNLYLTLLDKLGVPVENLGDSTGNLNLLSIA